MAAASLLITSGCATSFVRSESTDKPQHVFPATACDGQFFWHAGVKGEPLFAMADPNARINPVGRFVYGLGSIIDLPFSILFDTILLPLDLSRLGRDDTDTQPEPDSAMR